jgi:hypothetical protein
MEHPGSARLWSDGRNRGDLKWWRSVVLTTLRVMPLSTREMRDDDVHSNVRRDDVCARRSVGSMSTR